MSKVRAMEWLVLLTPFNLLAGGSAHNAARRATLIVHTRAITGWRVFRSL